MKQISKSIAAIALVALVAGVVLMVPANKVEAASNVGGLNNSLSDLFVLGALFGAPGAGVFGPGGIVPVYGYPVNYGAVGVMPNVPSGATSTEGGGGTQTQPTPTVVPGTLFPYSPFGYPGANLGNLLILDQLFSGGTKTTANTVTNGTNKASLGNLLILGQLFGGASQLGAYTGYGYGNNLANLFVLDKLFSGTSGLLSGNGTTGQTTPAATRTTRQNISAPRASISAPSSTINAPNSTINASTSTATR